MNSLFERLGGVNLVFTSFFIVGLLELLVILFIQLWRKKFIKKGYDAKAIVTDIITARGSKGGTVYKPVLKYNTYLNQEVQVTSNIGSSPSYYKIGDEIEIYYHPDQPKRFIISNDKRFRLMYIILGLVGGIFFIIGLIGLLAAFL